MQNIHPGNLMLIDIETVPQAPSFDELNEEWRSLWEEKTQRILPENISAAEFSQIDSTYGVTDHQSEWYRACQIT